jgi:large subunit ribosomal protein L9
MKVILLKDIKGVGKKHEIKEVAEGHALNMLIPRGMAKVATPSAVVRVEQEKAKDALNKIVHEDLILKNLKQLSELIIHIKEKANPKGHLFAGVHTEEIAMLVKKESQLDLDPSWIELDKPLKTTGEYEIVVKVQDKTATFKLIIDAK